MEQITANTMELLKQAPMTVDGYLASGIIDIDKRLGKGYASSHPELLGAYVMACAKDFHTSSLCSVIQSIEISLEEGVTRICEGIEDHPLPLT